MSPLCTLRRLRGDTAGSMVIETAIVAPVLAVLSLGGFEASSMVARQSELQSAAAEAEAIALASTPDTLQERNTIKAVIRASTGLAASKVTISNKYRCGTDAAKVANKATCPNADQVTTYLEIALTDTYTPVWTEFGIGSPLTYRVNRAVMVA